jgi:hypothetical protein
VILVFGLAVLSGCNRSRKIPDNFDYGATSKGIYHNDYFKFELLLPDHWVVQDKEHIKRIKEEGRKVIEENNKELAQQVRAADVNSAMLLSVFKYDIDSSSEKDNPSILIVAENLNSISGINSGADYLDHAKVLMRKSGAGYTFPSDYRSIVIGTKKFDIMDVEFQIREQPVQQSYFSTIDRGFALTAIISYSNKEEKEQLEDLVKDIKFR